MRWFDFHMIIRYSYLPSLPKTYFFGTVVTVVDTAVLPAKGVVRVEHFVALAIASAMHVSHNGNGYGNNYEERL